MRAYKCDICGTFYEKNATTKNKDLTIKQQIYSIVSRDCSYKADICPDCMVALQKVIDERRINEESKGGHR